MENSAGRHAVGQSPPRRDGAGKVDGSALYVDDLVVDGCWHGVTVRSPCPRARIASIDARAARALPEVVVLTANDLPGPNVLRVIGDDWPALAAEVVNHVAEPVALVAAPTLARAREAAALVEVRYEELPAVLELESALAAPRVLAEHGIDHGDVERALAAAAHVVEATYETAHQEHAYIENQGMLAIPHEDGSLELLGSLQCPFYAHKSVAHLLGYAEDELRVRQVATGGGFGGKEEFPDMIGGHAALLALAAKRPVKLVYERHEDIIGTTKRHPSRVRHKTGVDADGRLVAMDVELVLDGGAYTTLSPVVLSRAVIHAGGAYRCPNVRIRGRVLATNTAPNGAFRGFGAPQAQFAVERQLDRVARALGLDPFTIRERNAYRPGDVTPTGQVLDESTSALDCLREAERRTGFRARWSANEAARGTRPDDGRPVPGIGLTLCWHGSGFTGEGEARMRSPVALDLDQDGRVCVRVAATDYGQGTTTVLAQIVADAVGVELDDVRVAQPDTALVPDSGPTVASRTVMVVGGTLARAGRELARKLCERAAQARGLEASGLRVDGGRVVDAAGQLVATLAELAEEGPLEAVAHYEPPPGVAFDERSFQGAAYAAYGYGANVLEVEVCPDTLSVQPRKLTAVYDVGQVIHPTLCAGQVEGGLLQSIGQGYLEELKLEGGRYLNDTLSTYVIPTALDAPAMETVLLEHAGEVAAKGVGEMPADSGAAAVVQAIENATGIAARRAPATPEVLVEEAGL